MVLEVRGLNIGFQTTREIAPVVRNVHFGLEKGQTLGIVGESGSGKSVTVLSILGLLPPTARVSGSILFDPRQQGRDRVDLLTLPERDLHRYRGGDIGMIYQEPMTALNPVFRCGPQVAEAMLLHKPYTAAEARERTLDLFEKVRLTDPERIFRAYPHELSGGQKQRVLIAMALSCNPKILIADEPTTALDVTVQSAILDLLRDLRVEFGLSMIFISHDLGVIAEIAHQVVVMKSGLIVESGATEQVLQAPAQPYTRGLVACRPSLKKQLYRLPTIENIEEDRHTDARVVTEEESARRLAGLQNAPALLTVRNLSVRYPSRKNWFGAPTEWVKAIDDVSFEVFPGEIFGIAGESGCGKTTLARAICRLEEAHSGEIKFAGARISDLSNTYFQAYRKKIQIAFQDPYSSLNPRMPIGEAVLEPMEIHQLWNNDRQRREKVHELLETVGLPADAVGRYPSEFSGGQRQRICLARALAVEPQLLICDEIVSALDVSVQATVLNLLKDLQEKFGLTYLFISHDLSVIRQMCDRLMVLQHSKIVAVDTPGALFSRSEHPYVRSLLEAVPG